MKYVKKPIPVEAFQWNGEVFLAGPLAGVIHSVYATSIPPMRAVTGYSGLINTLEGVLHVKSGDWIVGPGVRGEYWPVQDDIFRETYEVIHE